MHINVVEARVAANTFRALALVEQDGEVYVLMQRALVRATKARVPLHDLALARPQDVDIMRGKRYRRFLSDNLNLAWEPLMRSSGRSVDAATATLTSDTVGQAETALREWIATQPLGLDPKIIAPMKKAVAEQIAKNLSITWSPKTGFRGAGSDSTLPILEVVEIDYGPMKVRVFQHPGEPLDDIYCEGYTQGTDEESEQAEDAAAGGDDTTYPHEDDPVFQD